MRVPRPNHIILRPLSRNRVAAVFLTAALLTTSFSGISAASGSASPAADPAVITYWNQIAVDVIVVQAGKGNAEAFLWYAFDQLAVYNAVVGITGRYELYKSHRHASRRASPQAAAAAAAHRVLLTYFPSSKAYLDAALKTSLAPVPNGRAKTRGIHFGERAARHIIRLRIGDGRFGPLAFTERPAPGVWRPTLPAFLPFFDPWLAKMRPLMLRSTKQFRPGPPPALTSARYAAELNEVKDLGSEGSAMRKPKQTETALFFSDIAVGPLQGALRDLVTRHGLDISDSARLFAAVDASAADAIGVVWDSKFHFGFWRPITAIRKAARDGNPATKPDTGWLPKIPTPPYPEYASGLNGIMGAVTRALSRVLGTRHVDLNITSAAAGPPGSPLVRHYELARQLNRDAINARVWSGIHFRTADAVGNRMGRRVGDYALDHYFKP